MPLLHGGCVVIAPPDDEAVGELLAEARVTAVLMEGPEISGLLEVRSYSAKTCLVVTALNTLALPSISLPLLLGFPKKGCVSTASPCIWWSGTSRHTQHVQ